MVKQAAQTRMDYLLARDRDRQLKEQWYDAGKDDGIITGAANMLKKPNYSPSEIVNQLVATYHIDEAFAEKYLEESDKVTV